MGKNKNKRTSRKVLDALLVKLLERRSEADAALVNAVEVSELTQRLRANPGDAQAKFDLGLLYFWADPPKAKSLLNEAAAGQPDNALCWIALMCFHVVRWRISHCSEETLEAWAILQRNQRLLWSVASPRLLYFFALVFKIHGDFDRAFKVATEFVVRHPGKPFTREMARLGAEVAFAQNRHPECMRLLETLTEMDPPPATATASADSGSFDADRAALYFLQCRMYDISAAGGRKPVNRGIIFRQKHPDGTLSALYLEAWRRSEDRLKGGPASSSSSSSESPGSTASSTDHGNGAGSTTEAEQPLHSFQTPTSSPKRSSLRGSHGAGERKNPPTPKQVTRRVMTWVGEPTTWWKAVERHYALDEHFFAESFVQAFMCTLLESAKGRKVKYAHMSAEQFLMCAEIYLAVDNVPVATEFAERALALSETDGFSPAAVLGIRKFLAKVSPEWAHAHQTAERLTIRLQRFWRAKMKRREFKVVKGHVLKLQALFRGSAARRSMARRRQHIAAMDLQRHFRGLKARKDAKVMDKQAKATKLTAWVRAAKVRKQQQFLHKTATKIQSLVRRKNAEVKADNQRRRWHAGLLKVAKCCVNFCHDARRLAFEVWRMRTPPLVRAVASLLKLKQLPLPSQVKTLHLVQVDETEVEAVNIEDAVVSELRDPMLSTHGAAHARRLGLRWSVAVSQNRHRWPDLVLTSPQSRALQTACLVFKQAAVVAPRAVATSAGGRSIVARQAPTSAIVAHPALCDFRGKRTSRGGAPARRRGTVAGPGGQHRRSKSTTTGKSTGRFGVVCAGTDTQKKGLLARKGRGAVAAAKLSRAVGGSLSDLGSVAAAAATVVTREELQELKMEGRPVVELMADRRLTRLARFKHVDFGLLAPGDWWCDTTFTGPPKQLLIDQPQHKHQLQASSSQSGQQQHRRASSMAPLDKVAAAAAATTAASFFTFPTGMRRVNKFVAWLASREERHVSVVTDAQVIHALLQLRHKQDAKTKKVGGNGHPKGASSHDLMREAAHDVEVLTDLISEVYDCCQTYDCYSFNDVLLEKVDVLERMAAIQTRWWQRKAWIFTRDQSMRTLLRARLVQNGVAQPRAHEAEEANTSSVVVRQRAREHPEPINISANLFQPVAEKSAGEQCAASTSARLPAVLAFARPSDTRRELVQLFNTVDEAVTKNRKQLLKLRQMGKEQFDTLEGAMAAVWSEVTEADLLGIRSEKYIPDLLRDVYGGVMIFFGHTGGQSFDTSAVQRFFGTKNIRDRIANCDFNDKGKLRGSTHTRAQAEAKDQHSHEEEDSHAVDDEVKGIIHIIFGEGGSEYDHLAEIHRPPKRVHRIIGGYLKERWISFDDRNLSTLLERRNMPQFASAVPIARWVTAVYEFWLAIPGHIVEILSLEHSTYVLHELQMEILAHFVDYSTTDRDGQMCDEAELSEYRRMQKILLEHAEEDAEVFSKLHPSSPKPKLSTNFGQDGDEKESDGTQEDILGAVETDVGDEKRDGASKIEEHEDKKEIPELGNNQQRSSGAHTHRESKENETKVGQGSVAPARVHIAAVDDAAQKKMKGRSVEVADTDGGVGANEDETKTEASTTHESLEVSNDSTEGGDASVRTVNPAVGEANQGGGATASVTTNHSVVLI